ncbi:hypothetical protein Desca_0653 [Desulfotomaculum nigrificans CO-1-SRB]|jgi:hypothetical protein|uniref:DUF5348 domain-containing protein n=2 Tax=Eubacteriales TaxID=186802 RepID=F6B893_DESCC|nr:DUF5348 domain-containing protein [Desulfotomaculum nigrificans]AEF93203.1 hypothetical protein Desca_0302 [Desulfotomaculum nigrificans CO-1-SRB]AEF93538.1 hypothetical protein Desca_0653 [Desulfotomaculum nigrificans CO-1-SRB]
MMRRGVEMRYDSQQDRWVVVLGNREYGLHCGEYFQLLVGKTNIACRLELDSEWYVIMQDVRLNLKIQETYRVII